MSKKSTETEEFINLLEKIIDVRFKYLRELEYENHRYARKILIENYNPLIEKISEILEKNN